MKEYNKLLVEVVDKGRKRKDRTGTGTVSVFGRQIRFDMADGFPLYGGRFIPFKPNVAELKWYLIGSSSNVTLNKLGSGVWNKWALKTPIKDEDDNVIYAEGELGPVYGVQWRNYDGIDQIKELVNGLINNPYSRRHIVDTWNPKVLPDESKSHLQNIGDGKAVLPPCHTFFQCYVEEMTHEDRVHAFNIENRCHFHMGSADDIVSSDTQSRFLDKYGIPKQRLSLQLYMRSCDIPVGLPFNIAQYALLLHLLGKTCGMTPHELIVTFGDAHIYLDQISQVEELLKRDMPELPRLSLPDGQDLFNFDVDIVVAALTGYESGDKLPMPVSV